MFSFFSPFPFLRILGLWVIGLLCYPHGYVLLAVILPLAFLKCRLISSLLLIGFAFIRIYQISTEFTQFIPKHDAFVFQVNQAPMRGPRAWKTQAKIIAVRNGEQWVNVHAVCNLFIPGKDFVPRRGQVIQAYATIKPIPLPLLPGAFDWRHYYALQRIYATAFVSVDRLKLLRNASAMQSVFERMRTEASTYLHRVLPQGVHRNVADAMFLGMGLSLIHI